MICYCGQKRYVARIILRIKIHIIFYLATISLRNESLELPLNTQNNSKVFLSLSYLNNQNFFISFLIYDLSVFLIAYL